MHRTDDERNCYTYSGSGTYWRKHLKKHGKSIETKILFKTKDKELFNLVAEEYSNKFNVAESKEFANLTEEKGDGGNTVVDSKLHGERTMNGWLKNGITIESRKAHMRELSKKYQHLGADGAKKKLAGVPKSEAHKIALRGKRPHVNQTGGNNNNAVSIETPHGKFESISECARFMQPMLGFDYKKTYNIVCRRVSGNKYPDWKRTTL